ncbi:MAG: HipA N-terminal domain-containing protein [Burkholderiaceae bacterium]
MSKQDNALEVWLDDGLGPPCLVGTLAHDRGQIRFHYERDWLKDPRAFALDPDLSLDEHPFFPKPELGNFGIFLDSSPDRWGQTLMKRREALQSKDEKRPPRTLYAWDFLIGVQDQTRQGALRFRRPGPETFLGNEKMAAPPVTMTGTSGPGSTLFTNWPGKPAWMCRAQGESNSTTTSTPSACKGSIARMNAIRRSPRP